MDDCHISQLVPYGPRQQNQVALVPAIATCQPDRPFLPSLLHSASTWPLCSLGPHPRGQRSGDREVWGENTQERRDEGPSDAAGDPAVRRTERPPLAWPLCSCGCGGSCRRGKKEVSWAREKAGLRDRARAPGRRGAGLTQSSWTASKRRVHRQGPAGLRPPRECVLTRIPPGAPRPRAGESEPRRNGPLSAALPTVLG